MTITSLSQQIFYSTLFAVQILPSAFPRSLEWHSLFCVHVSKKINGDKLYVIRWLSTEQRQYTIHCLP